MKRFFINISIILALLLLFFVGFFVILVLSPGSKIFGIQYISAKIGNAEIVNEWPEYIEGDIYINTKEIPVNINFEPYGKTKVNFAQHYSGYTTGDVKVPDVEVIKDSKGITVNTNEIEKFFIGNNHDTALTITLPSSWGTDGRHSIYVNGKKSKIVMNADSSVNLKFVQLQLIGNSDCVLNCSISARDLDIYASRDLCLDEKLQVENLKVKSKSANVLVKYPLEGNIESNTVAGDVKFISCNNIKHTSSSGKVSGIENGCVIYGTANIKTNNGSIKIKTLNSNSEENLIVSNSGNITIEVMKNGSVKSSRGKILVNKSVNLNVESGLGRVQVEHVSNNLNILSKRGDVFVGKYGVDGTVKNMQISSDYGDVFVKNAIGKTSINTKNGNIEFVNTKSRDITLSAGKVVTGLGLRGKVSVISNSKMNLEFVSIGSDVNIAGKKKCKEINISVENDSYNEINYSLKTTGKNDQIVKLYNGKDLLAQGNDVVSENVDLSKPSLSLVSEKCSVNVYLKKAI